MESYVQVTEGYYYVRKGDTARSVAKAVYGDQNQYAKLLKANPEEWEPGMTIAVPGVRGRVDKARFHESHVSLIKRIYPGQAVHMFQNRLFVWNGGSERVFEEGDLVFLPER